MNRVSSWIILFVSCFFTFSSYSNSGAIVSYVSVEGTINPGSADYIESAVRKSMKANYKALIVELNTPGGLLSSTRQIIQAISKSEIPVIVFITPGGASATSAGAIITVASHYAVMAPGTNIGAAHPVSGGGKDIEGDMGKKVTNDTAALIRAQAKLHGRNEKIAEEVVRKSISLSASEAQEKKLIEAVASSREEILELIDGKTFKLAGGKKEVLLATKSASLVRIEMTVAQNFLHLIANPNISTILMALGGMAIYAEVSSGFSLIFPGVIGVILLILAFISLQTLPINVGAVVLFALGMVLIVAEAFVTSFGILSICGITSLIIGSMFLIDPAGGNIQVSMELIVPIILGIGSIMLLVAYQIAKDRRVSSKSLNEISPGDKGLVKFVEDDGRSGQVFVHGELWKFESDERINAKDKVVVQGKEDMILKVKK